MPQKEDKIQLKQTGDHIAKRSSQKNFYTVKEHVTVVMKVIIMMSYNENKSYGGFCQQLLQNSFTNSSTKIINDFTVRKHYSGTHTC